MFKVRLPCCLGLKSRQSVSINVNKTRKHFSRNTHSWRAHVSPMFPSFPYTGNIASRLSFLFSRCKLCLRYTAENFNENPSMRALAKIMRARTSEHSSNFWEQFEQRPNFASTFKLDGTIRYPFISPCHMYWSRISLPAPAIRRSVLSVCKICSAFRFCIYLYCGFVWEDKRRSWRKKTWEATPM